MLLGLICLLILNSALSAEKEDIINYNWRELFTEPCEIVYVIMDDWTTFTFSDQDENKIDFVIGTLEKQLRTQERNYKIEDIAIIIHNHLKDCRFSPKDYIQYRRLKKYGFQGLFLLYSNITKKVYDIGR